MSFFVATSADGGTNDGLLPYLMVLDQYQLEEFKLCLEPRTLVDFCSAPQGHFPHIPWANLRAADPLNLFFVLDEHFPKGQAWNVVLGIFHAMNLTSLCEKVRAKMKGNVQTQEPQDVTEEDAEMPEAAAGNVQTQEWQDPNQEPEELEEAAGNGQMQGCQDPNQEEPEEPEEADHRRKYREKMRATVLEKWDNNAWPEDHVYIHSTSEDEHQDLQRLLDPDGTGAQAQTIVLTGRAGVGKTTLAMKALLHWADGVLFQQRFSYVFYLSCCRMRHMKETTFAKLISRDWPGSDAPVEEFLSQPEKLLFIVDGCENMIAAEPCSDGPDGGPPCTDWYQELPVTRILLGLLKKELVPQATLLITIETFYLTDLRGLVVNPRFVHMTGFTDEDLWVYFMRHFEDPSEVRKILQQIRKNETLFESCSAPMVCWIVCACLKQPRVRYYALRSVTETATALYACFVTNLFSTAEVDLADDSWPGQWRALCSLAIEGLWSVAFMFNTQATQRQGLEAPFLDYLHQLNILQKVGDGGGCFTFTHPSLQEFFAAMSFMLEEPEEFLQHSPKYEEMKLLLQDALIDKEPCWTPVVLFLFGLLNRSIARELESTLRCKVSPRKTEELLEWWEGLDKAESASVQFHVLRFFLCLHESQEEGFVEKMLDRTFEVDLHILREEELKAASFCLKQCKGLTKLRLSVGSHILERDVDTLETSMVSSRMHAWNTICSTLVTNENVRELDLSNSKLHASSVKALCLALKNPRCKVQKLTCKSVTPEWILKELILALQGHSKLTHLNLSCNKLGVTAPLILKALKHSACKLKCLCLEKCSLSGASCQDLALFLMSIRQVTRLCLGYNRLQDDGVKLLGAALTHPECALQRLELWFCQLGARGCRHLSDALLQNRTLMHLNVSKNCLGDEGVKFLCEALGHPDCNLRSLNLSGCSFTREGCQELATALKHNPSVEILDVGENDLRDDGVKLLCDALKASHHGLYTLGLAKCNLTSACCPPLASVLRSSKTLVNLNLLGNELDPDGAKMLCKALRKSTCRLQKLG
uniref:NLR family pyrin domain containing 13 n=1 Tax=Callithrix jacchus TaxID=9483 RepID=A0A8I3W2X8_CALJA|nr:NACHT, LRR and PYD domains-containing protein 13 isoform X1 [Callithrix jacchus]